MVVYKVDRLTRALGDFAKLVEIFDENGVSFVSVTQSFNTTSSMGRLTLNVLLSFAQFEREVIGERVRDKIAASKRKGIWVGGGVLLGYASVNKKLVVVPHEAEMVRTIFQRYLVLGSLKALAQDLEASGIRTRRKVLSTGKIRGGTPFQIGGLIFLLRNRFFIGEVVYRGEVHRGEHEPILDRALFDAVQAKLAANAVSRRAKLKGSPAILMGRIFDDRGNRMTPSHANKLGVRYRYYVSRAIVQGGKADESSVRRIPAPETEAQVVTAIREHLKMVGVDPHQVPGSNRELIDRYLDRVVVTPEAIEVRVLGDTGAGNRADDRSRHERPDRLPATIALPRTVPGLAAVKGVVHAPAQRATLAPEARDALLEAIAKARVWIDDLVSGKVASLDEIARRERKAERHVRLLAPLAFVSPRLVSAIVGGDGAADLTVTGFAIALPFSWIQQLEAAA